MSSILQKAKLEVGDLCTDLADGRNLLELIAGEKLDRLNSGKIRVHRVENVNKNLAFPHTKVAMSFKDGCDEGWCIEKRIMQQKFASTINCRSSVYERGTEGEHHF